MRRTSGRDLVILGTILLLVAATNLALSFVEDSRTILIGAGLIACAGLAQIGLGLSRLEESDASRDGDSA